MNFSLTIFDFFLCKALYPLLVVVKYFSSIYWFYLGTFVQY